MLIVTCRQTYRPSCFFLHRGNFQVVPHENLVHPHQQLSQGGQAAHKTDCSSCSVNLWEIWVHSELGSHDAKAKPGGFGLWFYELQVCLTSCLGILCGVQRIPGKQNLQRTFSTDVWQVPRGVPQIHQPGCWVWSSCFIHPIHIYTSSSVNCWELGNGR